MGSLGVSGAVNVCHRSCGCLHHLFLPGGLHEASYEVRRVGPCIEKTPSHDKQRVVTPPSSSAPTKLGRASEMTLLLNRAH
eukprot:2145892-Amphidinium_carterae.1